MIALNTTFYFRTDLLPIVITISISIRITIAISIGIMSVGSTVKKVGIGLSLSLGFWFSISRPLAVVSVGETVVRIHVAVGVRSIGVGEGGVVMVAVAVVTSPHSRVVHPWVGLRISLGLGGGLSNRLGLSLFHSNNGLLRRSCDSGGSCNNSRGYERSVGAWNKD